jgi:DHA2 family multidrug resistance protein-like MFS transporter
MTTQSASVRWQLWIVAFGFFMQSLDTTICNTALPSIATSLGESPLHMHGVIVAYVLTVATVLPASGWLADRVGVKYIFFAAIILFSLGSLLCANATELNHLIMARILQGVGGAMMVPVGRLTVLKIVPRSEYMAAMTMVTIPGQIGPLLGPALGGFLVQYVSWHWIFLINLPVGIIGALATLLLMPNYRMETPPFDVTGFLLLALSMACLTLALEGQQGMGLTSLQLTAMAITGVAALLGYAGYARYQRTPLFPLQLFNTHTFSLGLSGSFVARIGSGMLPFMTPIFLQLGLGFSPFHAGMLMIPMVIGSIGMKKVVVNLVNQLGYRRALVIATLLLSLITLSLPLLTIYVSLWCAPLVLFFQGMVNSLRFSAMNTLTLKDLPPAHASSGNSLLSMIMQLSMSLGVSVAGILLALFAQQQVIPGSNAMHHTFLLSYLFMTVIMALPTWVFAYVADQPKQIAHPDYDETRHSTMDMEKK